MANYKPDEHLIVSLISTGEAGKDAVIHHMMAVRVDQWGKSFSDQKEFPDKQGREMLTITLFETDIRSEMKADFDHVVYEHGKIVLRFSGTTILQR